MSGQHTPGPWEVRASRMATCGDLYTVSRAAARKKGCSVRMPREHMEYASDGRPMLYCLASARAAIAKAQGAQAQSPA